MLFRSMVLVMAACVVALFTQAALASDKIHEGKVVKADNGMLVMTDKDGTNKHTHRVPLTVRITCDEKDCRLEDLRPGYSVRVTTKEDETTVTKIEASTKEKTSR